MATVGAVKGRPRKVAPETKQDIQDVDFTPVDDNAKETETPQPAFYAQAEQRQPEQRQTSFATETLHAEKGGVQIDFTNDSAADQYFSAPSKPYENPYSDAEPEVQIGYEEQSSKTGDIKPQISASELSDVADFVIELFDMGVSMVCAKVADEENSAKYEAPVAKKKKLSDMLSLIMEKRNTGDGLSIEFLFLIAVVLAYAAPVKMALKERSVKRANNDSNTAQNNTGPKLAVA